MIESAAGLGMCQVRSGTDDPCLELAVVEVLGVPFCERCACEQEAYFAVGELARPRGSEEDGLEGWSGRLSGTTLAEALSKIRWGSVREKVSEAEVLVKSVR